MQEKSPISKITPESPLSKIAPISKIAPESPLSKIAPISKIAPKSAAWYHGVQVNRLLPPAHLHTSLDKIE